MLKIVKHNEKLIIGTATYIKQEFRIRVNDKLYKVVVPIDKNVKYLYSLPSNNVYKHWTRKKYKYSKTHNIKLINLYWSSLKPGFKVSGVINGDIFIIKKIKK